VKIGDIAVGEALEKRLELAISLDRAKDVPQRYVGLDPAGPRQRVKCGGEVARNVPARLTIPSEGQDAVLGNADLANH
jgi:hypothetical protein